MPRLPRIAIENIPHHVVQRGNRSQQVFLRKEDKKTYLRILRSRAKKYGVHFWAYCLMDNHVHFIAVPETTQSLSKCFQETNKAYANAINLREGWKGTMWEGRFKSYPMDERYLYAAVRYVERNPVAAKMVARPEDYLYSSARAHILKISDPLLEPSFLESELPDWVDYLADHDGVADKKETKSIPWEQHASTGRPLGNMKFVEKLEKQLNRTLQKHKPGPKSELRGQIT